MRCFTDGKACTCNLDDVAKGRCPRDVIMEEEDFDPLRGPTGDNDTNFLNYLNGMVYDPSRIYA